MAEVTRVPIQPIEKGSLAKLWLGVIVAILLGAGVAWAALPKSVEVTELTAGTGANPGPEDVVFVHYVGKLDDGTEFDRSPDMTAPVQGIFPQGYPLQLDSMIPGFRTGLMQMQKGGKYELFIPSDQAYGDEPQPGSPIPPGADLVFEVEVVDFMSQADFERRLGILQQMMQAQGAGGPGAPLPPQP
jgi:FKBP-type peptidyl-prolyl cis-trans isomerase FkpA